MYAGLHPELREGGRTETASMPLPPTQLGLLEGGKGGKLFLPWLASCYDIYGPSVSLQSSLATSMCMHVAVHALHLVTVSNT